jgi:hypothetical protein
VAGTRTKNAAEPSWSRTCKSPSLDDGGRRP